MPLLLASARGSVVQFILVTLPFAAVLIYFLYLAYRRPTLPIYNLPYGYSDDEWNTANEETGTLIRMIDMLTIFLSLLVFWTMFTVYIMYFVPKRRRLIGSYLQIGESTVGDVLYDENTRGCCGRVSNDYGYAVYSHPDGNRLVRKRVRVFQRYTREKIAIILLPNRPLSGQARVDLEIDLLAASKERDHVNGAITIVSIVWVVFLMVAPLYILHQMKSVNDPEDDDELAKKLYFIVVGACIPFSFFVNWVRFQAYRNWLVNRGAVTADTEEARLGHGFLMTKPSEDGTGTYNIMTEDESYNGVLPDHRQMLPGNSQKQPLSPPWAQV